MKKIIHKIIFIFILLSFGLLMWPQKQVKALEQQTYPTTLMKTTYYMNYYEQENANTYEFIVQYVLENIAINALNDDEYFFLTEHYIALQKGINRNANTYIIETIETASYYTLFNIRITINKNFVDSVYGGLPYITNFFKDDLSLYIKYDLYNEVYIDGYEEGYGEGFADGRSYGRSMGYQEGYVDGQYEGYWSGYDEGYNDGYNNAYEEIITNDDYTLGYNDGFKDGEKSKIAQNNESFYNGIEKWLVPAIITVILVGGIVSITAIKRREQ